MQAIRGTALVVKLGPHLVLEVPQRSPDDVRASLARVVPRKRWHLVVDAKRHELVVRRVELRLRHLIPEFVVRLQHWSILLSLGAAKRHVRLHIKPRPLAIHHMHTQARTTSARPRMCSDPAPVPNSVRCGTPQSPPHLLTASLSACGARAST